MMRPRLHHLFVVGGAAAGIVAGLVVIDTDPPAWGVIFGAGAGLAGGAFLAAITSGEQLAGSSSSGRASSHRRPNPALRHWEASGPPSANGKHEDDTSEVQQDQDRPERDRPE